MPDTAWLLTVSHCVCFCGVPRLCLQVVQAWILILQGCLTCKDCIHVLQGCKGCALWWLPDHLQKVQGPLRAAEKCGLKYRFFPPSPALAQSRAHCPEPILLERKSMDWLMPIQTCFEPQRLLESFAPQITSVFHAPPTHTATSQTALYSQVCIPLRHKDCACPKWQRSNSELSNQAHKYSRRSAWIMIHVVVALTFSQYMQL